MPNTNRTAHILYRFFNADDELLYVGISCSPFSRFKQHQYEKLWFREVSHSTMEHFESRTALEAAEVKAIQTESPKHNIAHVAADPQPAEKLRIRVGTQAISVFGPDASRFARPDGITDDDPPPEMIREDYPCLKCQRFSVVRQIDERGFPLNNWVGCLLCDSEWTHREWVRAVVDTYGKR